MLKRYRLGLALATPNMSNNAEMMFFKFDLPSPFRIFFETEGNTESKYFTQVKCDACLLSNVIVCVSARAEERAKRRVTTADTVFI